MDFDRTSGGDVPPILGTSLVGAFCAEIAVMPVASTSPFPMARYTDDPPPACGDARP